MQLSSSSFLLALAFAARLAQAGAEDSLTLESSGAPVAAVFREVEGPFAPDRSMRFSAAVSLESPRPLTKPTATATRDINFDAELACVMIRQFGADGRELAADASLGAWRAGETKLVVEAAPAPGVARVVLECRLSGLAGRAEFSGFAFDPEAARLHLPEETRIVAEAGRAPRIEIDGKPFPSLLAHGQNLETSADADASVRDLELPYRQGLRLLSFNAWFDGVTKQDSPANLVRLAEEFPEAYFVVRLWLGPRNAFFTDYPDERAVFDDGAHTATSIGGVHSERLRRYMAAAIRRFALDLRKSPAAARLAGFVPMYYLTGEWQYGDPGSPMGEKPNEYRMAGFDENHRRAFGAWAVQKYGSLDAVNAAWGTRFGSIDDIAVPTAEERRRGDDGNFRDPATQQRVIDFSRFHSDSVAEAIARASQEIGRVFHDRVIVGPFYGYTLEHAWSTTGPQQQAHLALGGVLRSPDVDFHGGPYSYNSDNRAFGKPVDVNAVLDSAALHGKLAFLEEDTYTHVAKSPGDFLAPGEHLKTQTLDETLAVLRRNLGVAIARGYLIYWMGLLEDGRFNLPEIWETYDPVFQWLEGRPQRPAYRPEVALVIDEQSIPLLAEDSRAVTGRWLYELRSILARVDVPLGIYLQSDLDRIPDSVRMLVLATPYRIGEEEREVLRTRWMRDGRTVVFCHLADVFDNDVGKGNPGGITGIDGELIHASLQPVSVVSPGGALGAEAGTLFGDPVDRAAIFWRPKAKLPPLNPYLVVTDPDALVLARYRDDPHQRASVAMKRNDNWTSVVTGVHSLTPAMWRWLATEAGAHLYLEDPSGDFDHPDVVEATEDFLMLVSGRDGRRVLRVHAPATKLREIGGEGEIVSPQEGAFAIECQKGVPRMFEIVRQ